MTPHSTIVRAALVSARVTARERARWREAAAAADMTLAELIRDAVRARVLVLGEQRPSSQRASRGWQHG